MSDQKISQLTSLDNTTVAADDLLPIVDVSETGIARSKKITLGDVLSISDPAYAVVVQADIGTAPNEVPLNQYLGSMAYQDAANLSGLNSLNGDVFLDASGNVGVGTSTPGTRFEVLETNRANASNATNLQVFTSNTATQDVGGTVGMGGFFNGTSSKVIFGSIRGAKENATANNFSGYLGFQTITQGGALTERARIDSSGRLLVGKPSSSSGTAGIELAPSGQIIATSSGGSSGFFNRLASDGTLISMNRSNVTVGSISVTTTSTAYNTSSDYRLKDNIQDITGSGEFIDALQPRSWNWKADGSAGAGFIAHELQAVSPSSVVGEKDAVDADGNPEYQAVEYGSAEVIAMLVAEVKSLRARLTAAGL